MLVQILSRPLTDHSHVPRSEMELLVEGLRLAGGEILEDVAVFPTGDADAAVSACEEELRASWGERCPDLVHTFGVVATEAALNVGGPRVVATFDCQPAHPQLEGRLATQADAVLPLSRAEHEQWRRRGARSLHAGSFPFAVPIADRDACADASGYVVTASDDAMLDALVESMPHWGPNALVVMTRLSAARLESLRRTAELLQVADRLHYRPTPRGAGREQLWAGAALVVAGRDGSRHGGIVLEAAAHGVPALALARDAHHDHVLPGVTGMLISGVPSATELGRLVGELLVDAFGLRAMGISALVRLRSLHDPAQAGRRLLSLYESVAELAPVGASRADGGTQLAADRQALAVEYLPLARQLAGWYAGRGQAREDLVQVASLGLVRAAERFDPAHGKEFHSFAIPTILGELRKHFRDHAWAVHVPRALQETTLQVQRATEQLRQTLGHDPAPADLAKELGLVEEEVQQALRVDSEARCSHSLDHPVGDDDSVAELIGDVDPGMDRAEARSDVRAALRQLPEREQQVLLLRFYGERTQAEIAERLGISQVHVSRILARSLAVLRDHVLDDVPLPTGWQAAQDRQPGEPDGASVEGPGPSVPTPRRAS